MVSLRFLVKIGPKYFLKMAVNPLRTVQRATLGYNRLNKSINSIHLFDASTTGWLFKVFDSNLPETSVSNVL